MPCTGNASGLKSQLSCLPHLVLLAETRSVEKLARRLADESEAGADFFRLLGVSDLAPRVAQVEYH